MCLLWKVSQQCLKLCSNISYSTKFLFKTTVNDLNQAINIKFTLISTTVSFDSIFISTISNFSRKHIKVEMCINILQTFMHIRAFMCE